MLKNIFARIGYYGKGEHRPDLYKANLDIWLKGKKLEFDPVKYAKFGKSVLSVVEFDKDHCIYIVLPEDVFQSDKDLPDYYVHGLKEKRNSSEG